MKIIVWQYKPQQVQPVVVPLLPPDFLNVTRTYALMKIKEFSGDDH